MGGSITEINNELDFYTVVDSLGKGGFGEVFEAEEFWGGPNIALKLLNTDNMDEDVLKRFEKEIKIQTKLEHSNIVPILDFNTSNQNGIPYYTMPLAQKNFQKLLCEYRQNHLDPYMDDSDVQFYFEQILDAVRYAHSEGVIHRDLKPENILVYEEEILKVSDFGLGKFINRKTEILTKTVMKMGSEAYAAPEQFQEGNAKNVDQRADIFSLGKILYEIITFDFPLHIDAEKIEHSKYKRIVKKATKTNKERRYQTIEEMYHEFQLLSGNQCNNFSNPAEVLKKAYQEYKETNSKVELKNLIDILLLYKANYGIYTNILMKFDNITLKQMDKCYREEFYEVINQYLLHVKEVNHPFSFTDNIANFLIKLLYLVNDDDLQEEIMTVFLEIGYRHTRFYFGNVLESYFSSLDSDIERQIISREVIKYNPCQSRWIATYINKSK
uniref:serine/threonine-protein kinase n=1 Tax=Turicibacter sanguinis TaxID=154288 RepID=UPI0018A08B57